MNITRPSLINDTWPIILTPDRYEFHAARPEWESKRLESCAKLIQPRMTVYDLGAESGDFTALYRSWVGPTGNVVAVEPSPPYWPSIRQTWEANNFGPPPSWFSGFVSDITDLAPEHDDMAYSRVDDGTGWPVSSNGEVIPDFGFRHLCQQAASTPQITIDDLADRVGAPDAIVMDIEGSEYRALQGASRVLTDDRPLVWVSVHPMPLDEWYGRCPADIHVLMRDYGYRGDFLGVCTEELWLYTPR